VLGVLIARASGQPLETFLRERIFEPLGMRDTGFSVPAAKLDRLASCYQADPRTGVLVLHDDVSDSRWSRPPAFPDAGAGLVSTIDDYRAFGQMMLDGGSWRGERILSRLAVEAMTEDQITPQQKAVSEFFPGFWDSHGLGIRCLGRHQA
jgi:CubicO group peptidase (beta-lactamase class C family)